MNKEARVSKQIFALSNHFKKREYAKERNSLYHRGQPGARI